MRRRIALSDILRAAQQPCRIGGYIMSKVICDVCGTTYAETATQCPICGCAKNSVAQTNAGGEGTAYAYVRGGRFSKSNVRKRNRTGRDFERRSSAPAPAPRKRAEEKPAAVKKSEEKPVSRRTTAEKQADDGVAVNKGLIVVVIILLLAIVAVTAYICVKFMLPSGNNKPTEPGTSTSVTTTAPADPTETTGIGIPCESLRLSGTTIEFSEQGNSWLLNVEKSPADTTDTVVFTSSDESVVTVTETGMITAVGGGEAVITVTCGSISEECIVVCSFGDVTGPTNPVDPSFVFEFNTRYVDASTGKYDTTLESAGETWRAYKTDMSVAPEDIQWIVDDPSICTVEKGVVTAVAPGKTELHAVYNGVTYTCIIRCSWEAAEEPEETEPTEPEDGGDNGDADETVTVSISHKDVTLLLTSGTEYDRSFNLRLKDSNGKTLEVQWTADKDGIVSIEGNKITGLSVGETNVSATYEGVTYTCIVRVGQ